jgi:hypothetical protein
MNYKRIVMVGLASASLFTIGTAFADEIVVTTHAETLIVNADQVSRDQLKKANAAAVKKAVETVIADTKLDLDIRLIGPTSVKIANER